MTATLTPRPLARAIHQAYEDALAQWIREHSRGTDPEVFLTSELVGVTLTLNAPRHRPCYVWVEVQATKPWNAGTYGYRLYTGNKPRGSELIKRVT